MSGEIEVQFVENRINWKAFSVGMIVILIGTGCILLDIFRWKTKQLLGISIGCSLIASGLVIVLNTLLVERKKENPLQAWGLERIYTTRAERNVIADPNIDKAKYNIDGITFGLSNFRARYSAKIETCLKNGVNIRLLVMNPESPFLPTREQEEKMSEGTIKGHIIDLIRWAEVLNSKSYRGTFSIKGYSCMTLDYYWRVDDELYIGPYWYGYQSSNTITYKFVSGKKGFQHYSDYFESLWEDENITTPLVISKRSKIKR